MNYDSTLLNYFWHASPVVKAVMMLLAGASVVSWSYIVQRFFYLKNVAEEAAVFEQIFWSGENLSSLYGDHQVRAKAGDGLSALFYAGYKEFQRFRKQVPHADLNQVMDNTKRAMRVAQMREQEKLETHLSFLAIVGSISPYVGLFGTVWGIMQAFRALASVQQATIAMVAPGIAEALVATALGLFAAIPAVIAYSRYVNEIGQIMNRYDAFQEEFTNVLILQAQQSSQQSHQSHQSQSFSSAVTQNPIPDMMR